MGKTSVDAKRYIREWSEFFRDGKAVTFTLIDKFVDRYKKKKYLKQSLKRLIKRGLVLAKDKKLIPSKIGLKFFRKSTFKKSLPKTWDGRWYLISFDIPNEFNVKRDHLRRVLKFYNFYPLQKSLWAAPEQLASDLWEFIVENNLHKYCKVMAVNFLEGDGELRKYYKLSA
ncbi:MAG: hypothetical protein AAB884_02850 [Patescibacteria group bacterium]